MATGMMNAVSPATSARWPSVENYPIALRWPHALRQPLERAAAMQGKSVAEFAEYALRVALADAEPVLPPNLCSASSKYEEQPDQDEGV